MNEQIALSTLLKTRFLKLQEKNPGYSIRAYSKKLGVSPATLCMIFNGKRRCSRKLAAEIADRLLLDPIERASILEKFEIKKTQESKQNIIQYLKVSSDQYHAFSEWHYLAILNLARLSDFRNDPVWIGARVGISEKKVSEAIDRLLRLELLQKDQRGKLTRTHPALRTSDGISNLAIRKGHFDALERIKQSLEEDPIEIRDFSGVTLTMQRARLKEAKEFIRKFHEEFIELFGSDKKADEVYSLNMQMIPFTKPLTKPNQKRK